MTVFRNIVLVVLIAMSLAAGGAKIFRMPHEVAFFESAGLGIGFLLALGSFQIVAALMAATPDVRQMGLALIVLGFFASTLVIFMTGDFAFGAVSLTPVLLAALLIRSSTREKDGS